jgi:hypothetical protein
MATLKELKDEFKVLKQEKQLILDSEEYKKNMKSGFKTFMDTYNNTSTSERVSYNFLTRDASPLNLKLKEIEAKMVIIKDKIDNF